MSGQKGGKFIFSGVFFFFYSFFLLAILGLYRRAGIDRFAQANAVGVAETG